MINISSKYIGLITGALMVIVSLFMFYQLHLPDTGLVKYICFSIYSIGIIFALFNFKKSTKENASLKDYFSEGFKTFVVVALIMSIFTFVFYKVNPQIFESALQEINKYNALDKNKTPQELAENSTILKDRFVPMTVAVTTIMYMIIGALISLLGAAFLSQKKIN